jgi:DNA-binding response OmpR family regulator
MQTGWPVKLLVVEDDRKIAAAVKRALESEGFTVDVANNGDDGWWMATESTYDLIVLDIMLPGRSGVRLCGDLRAAGDWTPVLMLTARTAERDETGALEVGADDYLTKPFSFAVLIARIRTVLRRSERRDTVPSSIGSLRADFVARRVWSSDTEIELTRREFDVLEFLIRRNGEAVSKHEILKGVWEFEFEGDPNIVEVYVGRLRRKLDGPFGTEHIQTVRGVGYRIVGHAC